jgi:serine/threonine protein kinase
MKSDLTGIQQRNFCDDPGYRQIGNVARVYDAGTTESGRPYFVMEYVKGVPITEHCDRQKLTIEERLKLSVKVCERRREISLRLSGSKGRRLSLSLARATALLLPNIGVMR